MTSRDFLNHLLRPLGYRLERRAIDRLAGRQMEEDIDIILGHNSSPVCFDLGANDGQTVRDLLREFDSPQITAFEPCGGTFERLNGDYGKIPNVKLVHAAAGETDGELELNVYENAGMNSLLPMEGGVDPGLDGADRLAVVGREKVRVRSLDSYCAEHKIAQIDLLKMDCQGFEMPILRGARGLLEAKRIKCLYLEMNFRGLYRGQTTLEECRSYLEPLGMSLGGFYKQAFREKRLFQAEVVFNLNSA